MKTIFAISFLLVMVLLAFYPFIHEVIRRRGVRIRFCRRKAINEIEMQGILSELKMTRSIPGSTNKHELYTLCDCLNKLGIPVEYIELPCPPRLPKNYFLGGGGGGVLKIISRFSA